MSDTLRDRIAAVQAQHRSTIVSAHGLVECSCKPGWRLSTITDHDLHVADAVITALGLQPHLAKRIINGKPDQWVRRHTTDWEIVDD